MAREAIHVTIDNSFNPFGGMRGFKGRASSHDNTTTRLAQRVRL